MNKFYTYAVWIQWLIAIILAIIALGVMGFWLRMISVHFAYYLLIFLFAPVLQFTLTPLFRLLGVYYYLSPMLLVYAPSAKKYDLHNGTSFDYLFVMRKVPAGRTFQNVMLAFYLQGLLQIIEKLENEELPLTVEITGTSYFFSESTAERLGFSLQPPSWFYRFNLYINYLDLLWMYSIAKGKLASPNLKDIKAVTTTGAVLIEKKAYLESLYARLQPALNAVSGQPATE